MNLRKHKAYRIQLANLHGSQMQRKLDNWGKQWNAQADGKVVVDGLSNLIDEMFSKATPRQLAAELVEAPAAKFIVAKKSTGEVMFEFDTLPEAEAAIEKAKKAKKAALVLA